MSDQTFDKVWFVPDKATFANLNARKMKVQEAAIASIDRGILTVRHGSLEFLGYKRTGDNRKVEVPEIQMVSLVTWSHSGSAGMSTALMIEHGGQNSPIFVCDAKAWGDSRTRLLSIMDAIRETQPGIVVARERDLGEESSEPAERPELEAKQRSTKVPPGTRVVFGDAGTLALRGSRLYDWLEIPDWAREQIAPALEEGEVPRFLDRVGRGLVALTDRAIVRVSGSKKDRNHERYPWAGISDLRPGRQGSVDFTNHGVRVGVKGDVFWAIARWHPEIAKSVIVQDEDLAAARDTDIGEFGLGCLVTATLDEKSFAWRVLTSDTGTGQYAFVTIPILVRKETDAKHFYHLVDCPRCSAKLAIKVTCMRDGSASPDELRELFVYVDEGRAIPWREGEAMRVNYGDPYGPAFKYHHPACLDKKGNLKLRW